MEERIFICECGSLEHQAYFYYDVEDKQLTVNIHLVHRGFFKRAWAGIKYIFGYKSKYGDWDEFLFNDKNMALLKEFTQIV